MKVFNTYKVLIKFFFYITYPNMGSIVFHFITKTDINVSTTHRIIKKRKEKRKEFDCEQQLYMIYVTSTKLTCDKQ